jgi:hypothetical protein
MTRDGVYDSGMRLVRVGLLLALAAVGGAGGYLVSTADAGTTSFSGPEPVAAVSPSYPVNPLVVLPDSDRPALQPGLPLRRATVGAAPFDLTLPVPRGWDRSVPAAGEWRWYPPPGNVVNTYFLRVRLIGNQYQPVDRAVDARLDALRSSENVKGLEVLSRTDTSFVAEYVSDGYRRVTMEAYLAQEDADDSDAAYAWIALVGRRADRDGMNDLFDRIVSAVRT